MNKRLLQFAVSLLLAAALLPVGALAAPGMGEEHMVRIGLAYDNKSGSGTLTAANLENSVDSGYAFGYFDGDAVYHQVGYTTHTQITMLKTQNLYLSGGGYSSDPSPSAVGCYHIQLAGEYNSFDDAQAAASRVSGGFPAWIDGSLQVRVGAYITKQEALDAQADMGLTDGTIVGTSSNGISVVRTRTTQVLFQFDGAGLGRNLAVRPGLSDPASAITWFKGWKYYGAFEYIRNGSNGNMTVVNWVPMEQYVKGVVPYEIGSNRPMEAMKAQAVCNRTYAAVQYNKHKHDSKGFDLCNTTDCQVYHGAGSSINNPTAESDRACEETAGIYAWYDGDYAQTFYYSSNGGATEASRNVWGGSIPYLTGQPDPYEAYLADRIPGYRWSYTFSADELSDVLNAKGYMGRVTDFYVSKYTDAGNVYSITFACGNGKTYTFSKEDARTILGTLGAAKSSMHYTVSKGYGGSFYINQDASVASIGGLYAINGNGEVGVIPNGAYAITGTGTEILVATGDTSSHEDVWTVSGSGWGHNVGMSQWGAISMGEQGYTYEDILYFYYPGIDLGAY